MTGEAGGKPVAKGTAIIRPVPGWRGGLVQL